MYKYLRQSEEQKMAEDRQTIARQRQLIADTLFILQQSRSLIEQTKALIQDEERERAVTSGSHFDQPRNSTASKFTA
jgi:hypothetical protein